MGIGANLFYSTTNPENCLDWRVRPSDEQYDSQKERWNDLAEHLLEDLAERSGYQMASWLQGSYKFGTQVRPARLGHEFDIDLGVYFQWEGSPDEGHHSPVELKEFVQASLQTYSEDEENDAEGVDKPRVRCSRIHFADEFHIDVPAYHLDNKRDARALATAKDEWEVSDPKAIYRWWKDGISDQERPRCRRIVRYLKMWAALKIDEKARPSSILLTVLVAQSYLELDLEDLSGDDEIFREVIANIADRLNTSLVVPNPVNPSENINRLSPSDGRAFQSKLADLLSIADRALAASSKLEASDIWSEGFDHFFPVPSDEDLQEEARLLKSNDSRAIARTAFDPLVHVTATSRARTFEGINKIGPIPKGCKIKFVLANAHMLPSGATVNWTVRNAGFEAENTNDLGHVAGVGISAEEDSAYRGRHAMDVTIKLNGLLIGTRRIPVEVTGLGMPLRNPLSRPAWTKIRRK